MKWIAGFRAEKESATISSLHATQHIQANPLSIHEGIHMPALSIYPDKLTITIPIPQEMEGEVHTKLKDLSKMNKFTRELGFSCMYSGRDKYKYRYQKHYEIHHEPYESDYLSWATKRGNFSFLISLFPIDAKSVHKKGRRQQNFMRLEFNPNEALYNGTHRIYEFLEWLIGKDVAKDIYRNDRVTRIDMCVDTFKDLRTLIPYVSGVKETDLDPLPNGSTNMTFGTGNSLFRTIFYDKYVRNLSEDNIPLSYPHYRLEVRWKNLGLALADLNPSVMQNKLAAVEFFSKRLFKDPLFCESFKQDIGEFGLNEALSNLDVSLRKKYLRLLRKLYKVESVFDPMGKDLDIFLQILEPFYPLE